MSHLLADYYRVLCRARPTRPQIATACVLVVAFIYWQGFSDTTRRTLPPIPVTAEAVQQKDVTLFTTALGTVEAYVNVQVKSLVEGQLLGMYFKEGQLVKKDDQLFQIDPRPFEAALASAQAILAKDQVLYENANAILLRNTPLLKKGFISKEAFDQLISNKEAAEAAVKADEAAVENAKLQLSYTTIRSPVEGYTGHLLIDRGNLIKANDTNGLVTINQISPVDIVFSVSQEKLPLIRDEMKQDVVPILIQTDKEKGFILNGELVSIDNTIDQETGMIRLKAFFDNGEHVLWPGQYVDIKIPLKKINQALLVPTQSVQAGAEGSYVLIIDDEHKTHIRKVKVGPTIEDKTVIESGVSHNEKVVTSGYMRLKEGSLVEIRDESETK